MAETADPIAAACREHWPKLVGVVARETGSLELAEDAAQEAFAAALRTWPERGTPDHPDAWLLVTARRRAIDQLKRAERDAKRVRIAAGGAADQRADDELRLMFLCCHPALHPDAQVALTLRLVAGLSPGEIARGLHVKQRTLEQRLNRAKTKIRRAAIPLRSPEPGELAMRLDAVGAAIYLVFNEGYAAATGPALVRGDLADEAIRLGRLLCALAPDRSEPRALLALMLLHDSRRQARVDAAGELVRLEDQDRSAWDDGQIAEGVALLNDIAEQRPLGRYQLEASIAAHHSLAPSAQATDWEQIERLYRLLLAEWPSPFYELNRAVAVGMAYGPEHGLAIVDALVASGALDGYHLVPATRSELLARAGRRDLAAAAAREALTLVTNDCERRHLERRLGLLT